MVKKNVNNIETYRTIWHIEILEIYYTHISYYRIGFFWSEVLILSRLKQIKARFSGLCGYSKLSQASPRLVHGLKCKVLQWILKTASNSNLHPNNPARSFRQRSNRFLLRMCHEAPCKEWRCRGALGWGQFSVGKGWDTARWMMNFKPWSRLHDRIIEWLATR